MTDQRERGAFSPAGIGHGSDHHRDQDIRRDQVAWWSETKPTPTQEMLLGKLELLRGSLNQNLFLGLRVFEGHSAIYPKGGFYQRHRDAFSHNSERMISVVVYLNDNWQTADGGQLRVHHGSSSTDIEPTGGTMVCFLSRELEHEVLVSQRERLSLTGWFKVMA